MSLVRRRVSCIALLGAAAALASRPPACQAQSALPRKHLPHATSAAISAGDLMTRLYIFADDSMLGRQAGTEGNLKATAYIVEQVKRMGLAPAGDSGSYFQDVPLVHRTFSEQSSLGVDGASLAIYTDYAPIAARGTPWPVDGAHVIYGGDYTDSTTWISAGQAAGKFVVFSVPHETAGPLYVVPSVRGTSRFAKAAAVAVANLESAPPSAVEEFKTPMRALKASATGPASAVPLLMLVTTKTAAALLGAPLDSVRPGATGKTVRGTVALVEVPLPARNVVALLPGSDPKVSGEYMAIGAHSDHIGVRPKAMDHDSLRAYNTEVWRMRGRSTENPEPNPAQRAAIGVNVDSLRALAPSRPDSIANGADDDGSGSVAALEIAEAIAAGHERPRRSILFVWHTAEELGLLGARWFSDNLTVPRDSIVAQLNMDMIGRGSAEDWSGGGPFYLQLVGSRRLSTELGDLVEAVNSARRDPFTFDYSFDAHGHRENIYCRSDHYMYARYGIPIVFFTTGLHQDYHQLTDEPQYIDYAHMARVAQLVHDVALRVANLDHRLVVDRPKADPNGACRQ